MTDDLKALEHELRALRPRPLSAAASKRILAAMAKETAAKDNRPWLLAWGVAAAFATAAAVTVAALVVLWRALPAAAQAGGPQPVAAVTPMAAPVAPTPVRSERILLERQESGPVYLDGRPARRVELRYVDHLWWHDTASDKVLDCSQPHADVVFIDYAVH